MDGAGIQSKIYAGYAKAAQRLGFACDVFRPSAGTQPVATGNKVRTLLASFNAEDMKYTKPDKYGKATRYCLADGRLLRPGDYLVSAQDGTFFIAGMQSLLPILAVQCNAVAAFSRPTGAAGSGVALGGYGGAVAATDRQLATGVPLSLLQGSKGDKNDVQLPTDTRTPIWAVLLPALPGLMVRTSDILTDDLERRFSIQGAELTDLGWRLTATQVQT